MSKWERLKTKGKAKLDKVLSPRRNGSPSSQSSPKTSHASSTLSSLAKIDENRLNSPSAGVQDKEPAAGETGVPDAPGTKDHPAEHQRPDLWQAARQLLDEEHRKSLDRIIGFKGQEAQDRPTLSDCVQSVIDAAHDIESQEENGTRTWRPVHDCLVFLQ